MFQANRVNENGVAGGDPRLLSLSILINGRFRLFAVFGKSAARCRGVPHQKTLKNLEAPFGCKSH
jgi:hypothetical protein